MNCVKILKALKSSMKNWPIRRFLRFMTRRDLNCENINIVLYQNNLTILLFIPIVI